jgi:hypothetical protein
VCEAFSRGELSYSKVRAITRIATPSTEAELLMFARHGTTQHVEKIVRGYRRCLPAEAAERRHERRYVEWRYEADGSVVVNARLDPEEGELFLKALEKATEEAREHRRAAEDRGDGSAEPPRDRADALVTMARRSLGTEESCSADRFLVNVHVDAALLAGGDGSCRVENGASISAATA